MGEEEPSATGSPDPETYGVEYRRQFSTYDTVTRKLHGMLTDVVKQAGIDVVQIDCRTKSVESFIGKLERKSGTYTDPMRDITDLIGLRVITYYLEDVPKVEALIRDEFTLDEDNCADPGALLDPDRFGYLSTHFVVSVGDSRSGLAEWATFKGKRAEIQVRTATQHAWAAVEHKLTYKSIHEVPRDLKRRLSRLSAIFELADEQFSAAREAVDDLERRYAKELRSGNLDVEIDSSSLDAYIAESATVQHFRDLLHELGVNVRDPDHPAQSRRNMDRRDLVDVLDRLGIHTIGALDELLGDSDTTRDFFIHYLEVLGEPDGEGWAGFVEDWMTSDVLNKVKAPTQEISRVYAGKTVKALTEAIHGPS